MKAVRFLLLGILGGMGLVFLLVTAFLTLGFMSAAELTQNEATALPALQWSFGGVGAALLITGVSLFIGLGRGEKRRRELFQYGSIVSGVVEDVSRNYSVRVNGQSPWRVFVACTHPVTGEKVLVRSHNVFYPSAKAGDTVRVAFDPLNEKRFAVELPERKVLQ